MIKSASSREKFAAKLSPPDSNKQNSGLNFPVKLSTSLKFAPMSSRIAACGHPPVSTARMRSIGNASCFAKNSPSSFVNISFVTATMFSLLSYSVASFVKYPHSCNINAVFPVPTGPPIPTVKHLSEKSRFLYVAILRFKNDPLFGIGSCECGFKPSCECNVRPVDISS